METVQDVTRTDTGRSMVIVNEKEVHAHLAEPVRGSVEQTLNQLLDVEADELCGAKLYEHSLNRFDTRTGHYARSLRAKAVIVRDGISVTLTYMASPREHSTRIRTTNVLKRIMREIRRRTRVVGSFPDGNEATILVAARLRQIAGTKWGDRVYLDMSRLRDAADRGPGA